MSARRALALAAATATATAGTLVLAPAAQAKSITDYGFSGRAYGTKASVESASVESARTVPAYLGCTRMAGVQRSNGLASTSAGEGAGLTLEGVDNDAWSYRTLKRVGTKSRSKVAKVVLGDPRVPHIAISALTTTSHAYAVRRTGKFGSGSTFTSGPIDLATGTPLDEVDGGINDLLAEIAAAGADGYEVPGLGVLRFGGKNNFVRPAMANAAATALVVKLYGENTVEGGGDDIFVKVGKSRSTILRNLVAGVLRGKAVPVNPSTIADGLVTVGRVIDHPLPCQGTGGDVRTESLAALDLGNAGALEADGLAGRVWGVQRRDRSAKAWTEGTVATLNLGGGQVVVKGIRGRATVATSPRGAILQRSIKGSQIGSLVIDGEERALPADGDIEIPGLAKLEFFKTVRSKRGLRVAALRVTLLDGSGAVIDLGEARTYIARY